MKKILSLLLCVFLILPHIGYAANSPYVSYRVQSLQTPLGKKYLPEIEKIVPTLSDEKLKEIDTKLTPFPDTKGNESLRLLLLATQSLVQEEISQRNASPVKETALILESASETEKKKVLSSLGELQKGIQTPVQDFFSLLPDLIENQSFYEQNGDLSIGLDFALNEDLSYSGNILFSDYTAQNAGFDGNFSGKTSAKFSGKMYNETVSGEVSGDIKLISKDGTLYFISKDTKINVSESLQENFGIDLNDIAKKLNSLAEKNTYLSYIDPSSEQLEYIENFDLSALKNVLQEVSRKQLFEIRGKKSDGSFSLIPNKNFCDGYKKALHVFDPLYGASCSEEQYKDLVDMLDENEISLSVSLSESVNTFSVSFGNEASLDIVYKNSKIETLIFQVQDGSYNPGVHISYEPASGTFESSFKENSQEFAHLNFTHSKTRITSIDAEYTYSSSYQSIEAKLSLKDTKLNGSLEYSGFDEKYSCNLSGIIADKNGNVSGNCKNNSNNTENFSGKIAYDMRNNKNNISFSLLGNISDSSHFKYFIENVGTKKQNSKIKISAPSKSVDIQETFPELEQSTLIDEYPEGTTTVTDTYTETCYDFSQGESSCDRTFTDGTSSSCYYSQGKLSSCNIYGEKETQYCSYDENQKATCSIETDEYYYDAYENIYYFDEYYYDANSKEKKYYEIEE